MYLYFYVMPHEMDGAADIVAAWGAKAGGENWDIIRTAMGENRKEYSCKQGSFESGMRESQRPCFLFFLSFQGKRRK